MTTPIASDYAAIAAAMQTIKPATDQMEKDWYQVLSWASVLDGKVVEINCRQNGAVISSGGVETRCRALDELAAEAKALGEYE